ncbi:unnamed protein product [Fraxinus pennsylvanica]|uniref:Uncharacterized protein n=1 Tax=Fraxinus pennsylvanica TaxID=56036 RepID=A0AAD2A835_9LAMI|nr:unnamed protein product [Fraxinus pennsylvanica]
MSKITELHQWAVGCGPWLLTSTWANPMGEFLQGGNIHRHFFPQYFAHFFYKSRGFPSFCGGTVDQFLLNQRKSKWIRQTRLFSLTRSYYGCHPPGPLSTFVEVIGIADSNQSIQAEIWTNFGDNLDTASYNQVCQLANGDYKHLFI